MRGSPMTAMAAGFSQSLAGKQDWYGVQGGIWKPARLEARDPLHLSELAVRCAFDLARGTVTAKGRLSGEVAAGRPASAVPPGPDRG